MPKRKDINKILIVGAGPIVIGQACEFDYSGVQACRALREEGYQLVLVNSNPATIMTDPDTADRVYIEPLLPEVIAKIIEKERPDALLPTMGGQTALNCSLALAEQNILKKFQVELIGASIDAIKKAEDRQTFRQAMQKIGLNTPKSIVIRNEEEAEAAQTQIDYPVIIRPSFTLGGSGGGIAYNYEEFVEFVRHGLDESPIGEILLEQSILGWKEYEMEVVRDCNDNCIIVCSIENIDPMGIHTGDSITVAPAQTLTDKEYQMMRNASIAIIREIGVDTGGANVQFAVNPKTGEQMVIEMNPRVSRSSALSSKATGFPIAKIAAKLAVGYTLDELKNEVTDGIAPASFEPSIDYVVTKIPRFTFEKFPQTEDLLTTQMKSVGETMAIGRTFAASLQKALCSLETGLTGLTPPPMPNNSTIQQSLALARPNRFLYAAEALRMGISISEIAQLSHYDPWFLTQLKMLIDVEQYCQNNRTQALTANALRRLKKQGFSDQRIAELTQQTEANIRALRKKYDIQPKFKRVDSCAAEFSTHTAYLYSSYDEECEATPSKKDKYLILGSGPNRIGQGIEFDYCCVQAALALREEGYETIMVNCNPETVSTDYDISDRLYFEPLTLENVLAIIELEQPKGVIVQYGGQTPLKLARGLADAGVNIIGTHPHSIEIAEDREHFQKLLHQLNIRQPPNQIARNKEEAVANAEKIGYPLVLRPSFVLGGQAMEIVHNQMELIVYMDTAIQQMQSGPILLDYFLADAIEIDIDAICDGQQIYIGGIMQHIEQAGIHSGDSACCLPPFNLDPNIIEQLSEQTKKIASALDVVGLINCQFAVQDNEIYVLEANPRASRTIPFVSKATGIQLAKIATRCMIGKTLSQQSIPSTNKLNCFCVKESVFPFTKLPGVDPLLGPEMKSTGEVMGIGKSFGEAFAKSQLAAGETIPFSGRAFISVKDKDKPSAVKIASELVNLGYHICATEGTWQAINQTNIPCEKVNKVREGRPHIVDLLKSKSINLIVNTTENKQAIKDSSSIRQAALKHKVFYTTTIAAANATIEAIKHGQNIQPICLQDLYETGEL